MCVSAPSLPFLSKSRKGGPFVKMAQPPVPHDALIGLLNNVANGQLVTKADLVPLATQAQLADVQAQMVQMQAQMVQLQTQLGQMQVQTQAQLGQMQVQIIAQVQALLAPHNAPAIAAAASATVQSIVASRLENSHDRTNVVCAVVLRADGTQPPHWPAGFGRSALFRGPIAVVDALLDDYGLPQAPHTAIWERRNALAVHIGIKQN